MKKSFTKNYAVTVCFVMVICAAIALGIGIYDVIEMSNPEMTLSSEQLEKHQTNEVFVRNWSSDKEMPGDREVTALREKSYEKALSAGARDAVKSFIRVVTVLVIIIVIFFVHWFLARSAREE